MSRPPPAAECPFCPTPTWPSSGAELSEKIDLEGATSATLAADEELLRAKLEGRDTTTSASTGTGPEVSGGGGGDPSSAPLGVAAAADAAAVSSGAPPTADEPAPPPVSLEQRAAEAQSSLQTLRDTCAAHRMELEKLRQEEKRNAGYIQSQARCGMEEEP